ncbi:MAG: hypothetical protein J6C23_03240 [Clostridia bacterium]|nr:hypothetical protein [Clostridia bacterium]
MCALFDDGISREREAYVEPNFCAGCSYLESERTDGTWCERCVCEIKSLKVDDLTYMGCPRADVERKSFHSRKPRR